MNATLEPPRVPGGPPICPSANLPAFDSKQAVRDYIERRCPGANVIAVEKCEACGKWHFRTARKSKS